MTTKLRMLSALCLALTLAHTLGQAAAAAEIEQERARAQEQLMTQVSALALAGAEKILAAEIDADKHADLLKSLAAES